jgi:hypothetical protein
VYWNTDGSLTWNSSVIAGSGSAFSFSAPAIVRSNGGTEVAATGPSGLDLYRNKDGSLTWKRSVIPGTDGTFSAPAIVRSNGSTEVAATGPNPIIP